MTALEATSRVSIHGNPFENDCCAPPAFVFVFQEAWGRWKEWGGADGRSGGGQPGGEGGDSKI